MSISISMVALGKNAKVSAQRIRREWEKNWPEMPAPGEPEKKEGTLAFRVGDADVIYGLMPAPIPWSDLEGPCQSSWLWPDAASEMQAHEKHMIVTVSADGDAIERLKVLTQATSALAASCDASVGIYWCDSQVVMSPEMFRDFAVTLLPDELPLYIWVDFRVGKKEGRTAGFTTGLSALGHMEIETRSSEEPPGELRERMFGLANYLIESGPVIQDGDTIGEDADERIKVVYSDSSFGQSGRVMRLVYGGQAGTKRGSRRTGKQRRPKEADGKRRSKMTTYGCVHLVATILTSIACGAGLFVLLGLWMSSVVLRVMVVLLPTLIGGFLLLVISDRILQALFGLEAFEDVE